MCYCITITAALSIGSISFSLPSESLDSPIRSAFDKIMDVMRRVPPHDWEEDFAKKAATPPPTASGPPTAASSNATDHPPAEPPTAATPLTVKPAPAAPPQPQLPSTSSSSTSKATYPVRARFPRKRGFSLDDASFKPWRTPSPKKKVEIVAGRGEGRRGAVVESVSVSVCLVCLFCPCSVRPPDGSTDQSAS